jgi:threonine dehydrogenase-like Zn-dependent dehydrogenase
VIGDASANLAAQVLVSGGHLVSPSISQGYKPPRDDVRADRVFTGGAYLAGGEALQRLALYAESIRDLLAVGKLKPTPIKRLEGLASVVQGLELLEQGKVSAAKLVVVPEQ